MSFAESFGYVNWVSGLRRVHVQCSWTLLLPPIIPKIPTFGDHIPVFKALFQGTRRFLVDMVDHCFGVGKFSG